MCWTEDRDGAVFDMEDTRRDLGQHYRYATNRMDVIVGDGLSVLGAVCAVMGCSVDHAGD
ncbi:hypothetical protein K239x_24640 [Planctomycetes bacterium K23_9]|uniref:Uncharacterized protein n=1 Tax=Stieleria marina TaxID=1930275 RepID=A0A517NTQ7_9BACT|nr:hypothetical protein K239x_24640 [Planctomycetes bacterium K23_9]